MIVNASARQATDLAKFHNALLPLMQTLESQAIRLVNLKSPQK
jgi:hypothetical protein